MNSEPFKPGTPELATLKCAFGPIPLPNRSSAMCPGRGQTPRGPASLDHDDLLFVQFTGQGLLIGFLGGGHKIIEAG